MSIQWTIIASFLYLEIVLVLLLVLPVASPKRWRSLFQSRFLAALNQQASLYFYVLLFILVLFLLDAIREMRKYSSAETHDKSSGHVHLDLEMQVNMRMFRAQRNFYISGFALFLSLVIRRLCTLISSLAYTQVQFEVTLKQSQNAAAATSKDLLKNSSTDEVKNLQSEVEKLKQELESERRDKEALKNQAEATNNEYDRLNEEYNKLLRKVPNVGSEGDKKSD